MNSMGSMAFVAAVAQGNKRRRMIIRRNKKRRNYIVINELIKKNIGQFCRMYDNSSVKSYNGRILDIKDNWVELETKKEIELINLDYVNRIRIYR